jgi:peptidoglycan/LPS O-acetylase OafA/YrhL
MVALFLGGLLLGVALLMSTQPVSFLHTPQFVFSVTYFGHFFEFFCGIFLALIILKKEKMGVIVLAGKKNTIAGGIGILVCMCILVFTGNNNPNHALPYYLINNFILPVPVAIMYYGLICEKSGLAAFLSLKWMGLLGRTSYAFYLVHMIVIESVALPYIAPHFTGYRNLYVLTIFLLCQLIAFFIFVFYELPLNKIIRANFSAKKTKQTGL